FPSYREPRAYRPTTHLPVAPAERRNIWRGAAPRPGAEARACQASSANDRPFSGRSLRRQRLLRDRHLHVLNIRDHEREHVLDDVIRELAAWRDGLHDI